MAWFNASIDETGEITAPNKEMNEIISSTMRRIADEPLYIIQRTREQACYTFSLRTFLYSNNNIRIICKDNQKQLFTSRFRWSKSRRCSSKGPSWRRFWPKCPELPAPELPVVTVDELPCEPKIITKNFLQEHIFPFQKGYLGYNESFSSGLTRGQFFEQQHLFKTNLTFCAKQSMK